MTNDGTFKHHILQTIDSAKQQSSWVLRTFKTRAEIPMLTLWKSLVLPKLEYCSQLWCPLRVGEIQRIEIIQWSFIRKIKQQKPLNYWETLAKYKLYSLQRRRERYRIIYAWKILEKLVPNLSEQDSSTTIKQVDSLRKGRYCSIPIVNSKSSKASQTLRSASFSSHAPSLFNCLPKSLRNLTGYSTDHFKHHLDKFLVTVPDEPLIPGYTAYRRADSNSLVHMTSLIDS